MATDELTADEVAISKLFAATHGEKFHSAVCDSHELLRADRDRLRVRVIELNEKADVLFRDRDRLREERDNAQTDHALLVDDYKDLQCDIDRLRQALETVQMHWSTLAAKDAEIQRLKKSDPTPWIRPENS